MGVVHWSVGCSEGQSHIMASDDVKAKKDELNTQLKDYITQWRDERSKEEEELKRLKKKQAKRKEIRAEQEKKAAEQKRTPVRRRQLRRSTTRRRITMRRRRKRSKIITSRLNIPYISLLP